VSDPDIVLKTLLFLKLKAGNDRNMLIAQIVDEEFTVH